MSGSNTSSANESGLYNNLIALNITQDNLNNNFAPVKIKDFQRGLVGLGFLKKNGFQLGQFDSATKEATIKFQKAFNLQVDGLAGIETQTKLHQEIKKVQEQLKLNKNRFGNDYLDEFDKLNKNPGFYGPATTSLVKKWDEINNLPHDQGIADVQSKHSLNTSREGNTNLNSSQIFLRPGDRGDDIKKIQERLKELGYLKKEETADYFDNEMAKAVIAFQHANQLSVQKLQGQDAAVIGETTKKVLFGNNAQKASGLSTSAIGNEKRQVSETQEVQRILEPAEIEKIAQKISVKIDSAGTGIITGKKSLGNGKYEYTVLTNDHVLLRFEDKAFSITTPSGKQVQAKAQNIYQKYTNPEDPDQPFLDIAVVKFTSSENLEVAKMVTAQEGEKTYSFGFPGGTQKFIQHERSYILPARTNQGGYQIFSEKPDLEKGMSGGPLLNSKGQVIGINGRLGIPYIEGDVNEEEYLANGNSFTNTSNRPGAIPIGMFIDTQTGRLRQTPNYNSVKGTWRP